MTILTPNTPASAYSATHAARAVQVATNADTLAALAYTVDEAEDLTARKVEALPISGDALARIVRTRRGIARALRTVDDFYTDVETANDNADYSLWNGSQRPVPTRTNGLDANRRMVAYGLTASGALYSFNKDGSGPIG